MSTAVIFLAGQISDYDRMSEYARQGDFVICADAGTVHADRMGILPDMIIGDMDSIPLTLLSKYKEKGVEIRLFNEDKDKTDSHLAIDIAIEKGYDDIILLGAVGSLPDHTITNIMLLEYICNRKKKGMILSDNAQMFVIKDHITLFNDGYDRVSLIPVSEKVTGVTTSGLRYPLKDEVLYRADSRGTSNRFNEKTARIGIKDGILLIIKAREGLMK